MSRKILIVDDNLVNRMMLKNVLEKDYDILEAENGKEALSVMHRHYKMLSAVLLDIVMPEMDGYEALQNIRDNIQLSQIPVIMVTGSEDEESRVRALSLGANDFILKPFNPDIVKHCLKNNIALRETASILNAIQKDKLTGLYNREAFFEKIAGMLEDHESGYYVISCFDIDNFKLINEQYGAAEGDRILKQIGKTVGKNAEEIGGIAGRISADNFAAFFPAKNKITVVLQKILDKELVSLEQQSVSFSIGRYEVTDLTLPASAIYDRAFIAKQSVKGRYDEHLAYFDDAMLERLVRDQQISDEMEAALDEHQFEAWFQPQYNHATGELLGAEALARWRHPQKGIMLPGEFIPLFEQNGFVYELDKYIWREVCVYLRKWIDKGYSMLPVSVNVSRYDIFRTDLAEVLTNLIKEYDIPVDLLRLEITESAFTSTSSRIVEIVRQLIDIGFTIEIDDFGSGYSSLNTLKNVPAQVVKLDMRFLDGGDDSKRGGNILESIVRMTKWLGMSVLAEGVEELEQADFLRTIGCTYVQGYLYAQPMPACEFEDLFNHSVIEPNSLAAVIDNHLTNDDFWDPMSIDSMVFNKYSGGACVYEFYNGHIEMVRVTDKYIHTVFSPQLSAMEAMRLDWEKHTEAKSLRTLNDALSESIKTGQEVTGEYIFLDIPYCPHETYLRSTIRVIASTEDRHLVYCTSVNTTPQWEAEQRGIAADDRLQAVMDNVGCGITAVIYNEDDIEYLMINDRYYELLGYTKAQQKEIGSGEIENFSHIHEDDRERVIDASKEVYVTGEPKTIEYRAIKKDGMLIWMRDSKTMTNISGIDKPVQLSMFFDITSERQGMSELLDNLPGGAALYEYDGKNFYSIHVNKRYWELMERAPMDYAGLWDMESIHPDDRDMVRMEVDSAISQNRDASCDIRVRFKKDGYRPVHLAGHIVAKAEGKYSVNVIYTPISDATMSIQEMLPVALQAVMDSSSEVSFVKGKDLKYISCSRRFLTFAGVSSERDILGKSSFSVFSENLARQYDDADKKIMQSGQSIVDFDVLFPTEGGVRRLLFSKYPLMDGKGNVLGIYGTGRDITEVRKAQSRLELLTNNIPGGIAIYEGIPDELDKIRLTYFSDGFCRIFGYTRDEYEKLAAVNPLGLVFAADISEMYEKVIALVKGGEPMDYVYRAMTNGGECKWVNVKAVMGEPGENNLSVNAVFFDVTEQKNTLEKLRMSEEINRLAIQQSKNVVCQYDIASKQLKVSPSANVIFELEPIEEDVPYKTIRDGKVSPDTTDAYTEFFESIAHGDREGKVLFQRISAIGWRWIEAHFSTIFSDSNEPVTAVISYADVTESIERDAAYKKWQQSLQDRSPDSYSLYHCNITKDRVINATEGLHMPDENDMNDLSLSERTASYVENYVFGEDRERYLSVMDRDVQLLRYSQGRKTDSMEYREKTSGNDVRWLKLTVDLVEAPHSDNVEAYMLFENIDDVKRAELDIIERAETDSLTGVLNRATFMQKVDEMIRKSKPNTRHAMMMLDIDSFKMVNDVFGHGTGDQTLIGIAELLRKESRRSDLVGRLGGDEFMVFLSDIPGEIIAAEKAEKICRLVDKDLGNGVRVTGSIGIALYPKDGGRFEELYKKSDKALYRVKNTGKNNYGFYIDNHEKKEQKI